MCDEEEFYVAAWNVIIALKRDHTFLLIQLY